tara:strand:- start:244 stop:435 length:192 start_codon:yes stop_codon:yes gene_type:complete
MLSFRIIVSFTKLSPAGISKTPILNLSELSSNSDLHEEKKKEKVQRKKHSVREEIIFLYKLIL